MVAPEFDDSVFPEVPAPGHLPVLERPPDAPDIPMSARYETRWAFGPLPFTSGERAEAGGWIRLAEPARADHALMAALCDAWIPPIFSRSSEPIMVPTIDLTVHFRAGDIPDDDWFFVRYRTRLSVEGFMEEDGEVWSRAGRLLAQSRQLALVLAVPP